MTHRFLLVITLVSFHMNVISGLDRQEQQVVVDVRMALGYDIKESPRALPTTESCISELRY